MGKTVGFTFVSLQSREWLKSHFFFLLGEVYDTVTQEHSGGRRGQSDMGLGDFGYVTSWTQAPPYHRGAVMSVFAHLTEKER